MEPLVARLDSAWAELRDSYEGLSESELTRPGALGEWSVKDVLAHVTTWEEEALKHLPTIARGERPPRYASEGGIDAFNARMAERKRDLSLETVLARMDETHATLVAYLRSTIEMTSRSRFVKRLRLDTYGHYRLHAEAIRGWRSTL